MGLYFIQARKIAMKNETYTVWVGGVEANPYPVALDVAHDIADEYIGQGYEDVEIEEIKHD